MAQAVAAVAVIGMAGFLIFCMKMRVSSLIINAKSVADIMRAAKSNLNDSQSRLVTEWITANSTPDHAGLADQMTPAEWREIERAVSSGSMLKDIARSRRLFVFRSALQKTNDPKEVIRVAQANALLTESMDRAATSRLKALQVPGPDYIWHWLDLSQHTQYPAWSESEATWRQESVKGLREWRHRDIIKFLGEVLRRELTAEAEWELPLLRRLNFAMLSGGDFETVETMAIVNGFDDLLKRLYNEAALFELVRRREASDA